MENNELMKDVIEMMTDGNIEKSLFDSGRIYGYNYEESINLEDQYIILHDNGEETIDADDIYVNLVVLILNNLELPDEEELEKFHELGVDEYTKQRIMDEKKMFYIPSIGCIEIYYYCGRLVEEEIVEGYTYNSDNDLDRDFLFKGCLGFDGFIIINTHNGCDARAGLSAPHLYEGDVESFLCGTSISVEDDIEWWEKLFNRKISVNK